MIVYLDTSSVVKLYLQRVNISEPGADAVRRLVEEADTVATSRITYAEVRAALAMARRQGRIAREEDYRGIVQDFNNDWPIFWAVSLSARVVRLAGDLAERHALRGYDAVQLASAMELERRLGVRISFSTYDSDMSRAAEVEGLVIASNGGTS